MSTGTVPFETVVGSPVPDARNLAGIDLPDHLDGLRPGRT